MNLNHATFTWNPEFALWHFMPDSSMQALYIVKGQSWLGANTDPRFHSRLYPPFILVYCNVKVKMLDLAIKFVVRLRIGPNVVFNIIHRTNCYLWRWGVSLKWRGKVEGGGEGTGFQILTYICSYSWSIWKQGSLQFKFLLGKPLKILEFAYLQWVKSSQTKQQL